mmetsp:Transcript_26702/g.67846  ORF Transcript_26702/g.67846 Transcript_26702/m.67846 type:complete len:93 (-) Transcript_26702:117-395(-)
MTNFSVAAARRSRRAQLQESLTESTQQVSEQYDIAEQTKQVRLFLQSKDSRVASADRKVHEVVAALAPMGAGSSAMVAATVNRPKAAKVSLL